MVTADSNNEEVWKSIICFNQSISEGRSLFTVFNVSINSKFNIPFPGIWTFENPPPRGKIVFKCPTQFFLQNWPSVKPRPCRPFFSHSHAKVNYLPLASPYLKIEHLYSAGKIGHYRFWFPLIPHSQPSKVQMVVTGLPVGGVGGGRGRGGRRLFKRLRNYRRLQTWKLS